jgi:Metallo-beta-lactamase superfamily
MTAAEPDLSPGVPRKLDRYVTRLVAPNPGVMTGPGTNTYLVGERQLAVIDPGPADAAHLEAILAAGAGRIRWILCTHTHLDHAAAASAGTSSMSLMCVSERSERDERPAMQTDPQLCCR